MKKILPVLTAVAFAACNLIEYHPYDVRLSYKNINLENIPLIEAACEGKDTVRFVWMGDTQRWYDETTDMVRHVNDRTDIDFVMHGGDISDFGLVREFEWVHEIMKKLTVPYVALIGNHDLLGNGLHVFEEMYGPLNFSFYAGRTKIVCLNTNALEFDYSYPVPDFEFMEQEFSDSLSGRYDQVIVAMHAEPFGEQFNNNAAEPFQYYLSQYKKLRFCLHAHTHNLTVQDYFDNGVIFYGCDAMKKRSYMVFTVTDNDYSYEVVYY